MEYLPVEELMDSKEVATLLCLSIATIERYVRKGILASLPRYKRSDSYYFEKKKIYEYIEMRKNNHSPEYLLDK